MNGSHGDGSGDDGEDDAVKRSRRAPRKSQMGALLDLIYELRLAQLGVETLPREVWASEIGVSEEMLSRLFWLPSERPPRNRPLGNSAVLSVLEYLGKLDLADGLMPSDVRTMLDRGWLDEKAERVEVLFARVLQEVANANQGFPRSGG
jgi:hypothetical protein